MHHFDSIIKLLDVSRITFDDDDEAQYFLRWFNRLVENKGESWIEDNKYLVRNQWEIERETRREEIEEELKKQAKLKMEAAMYDRFMASQVAAEIKKKGRRSVLKRLIYRLRGGRGS